MQDLEYARYREHKAAHRPLLDDLSDFTHSIGAGLFEKDLPAVIEYFRYSFPSHIKTHDMKLGHYVDRSSSRRSR